MLRAAEPTSSGRAVPAQSDQGRLPPLRPELLLAVPSRRPPGGIGRHLDMPHRLSLRRANMSLSLPGALLERVDAFLPATNVRAFADPRCVVRIKTAATVASGPTATRTRSC